MQPLLISSGVYARRRRSERAITTPVAATPTNPASEVLAATYQAMGLLSGRRRTSWYDAGRFWSGDDLRLSGGYRLSGEVAVTI